MSQYYGTLKEGSTGPWVTSLEYAMHIFNLYSGGFDGIYGGGLKQAVENFQTKVGLYKDGAVGVNTWSSIYARIQPLQHWLDIKWGIYCADDGIAGPATLAAVEEFQRRHGLTPDGYVGPETMAKLGINFWY